MFKINLLMIVFLLNGFHKFSTYDYQILPSDQLFFDCPRQATISINKYFNVENIEFQRVDDDILLLTGNFTTLVDLPTNTSVHLKMSVERKVRGSWTATIIRIEYNNFCSKLFDPNDIYYEHIEHWNKEQRHCPPKKGIVLTLNNRALGFNLKNMPLPYMEGEYRITTTVTCDPYKLCFQMYADLFRL